MVCVFALGVVAPGSDDVAATTQAGTEGTTESNDASDSAAGASTRERSPSADGSTPGDPSPDDTNGADAEPVCADDDQILRVAVHTFPPAGIDPIQLDLSDIEAISVSMFNGLVGYDDETEEFTPDLAESWSVSEDGTVYTFNLREGVQFHDGYGEMTAEDVAFSLDRARGSESLWATVFENIESVEVVDLYAVEVTLATPDSGFLTLMLNTRQGQIVSEAAVTDLGEDFAINPVGTGRFDLTEFDPATKRVSLRRFDDYFGSPSAAAGIDFTEIEQETAAVALESGDIDAVADIQGEETLERLQDSGFEIAFRPPFVLAVVLNPVVQPAFADVRVRQAMAHGVDRAGNIEALASLLEDPAINLVSPNFPEYTDDVQTYDYDPELAHQLLEEAGYGDGLTVTKLLRQSDGVSELDLLEQEQLAEVGIALEFELLDPAQFSERRNSGDFEYAIRALIGPTIDLVLRPILHPDYQPPVGFNGAYYDNPEVVSLLDQGRSNPLGPERDEIYAQLQQIVMEELPYIPETLLTQAWAAAPNLEGLEFDSLTTHTDFANACLIG